MTSNGSYVPDDEVNQGGITFTFDRASTPVKFGIALPGIASDPLTNFIADQHSGTNTEQAGRRTYKDIWSGSLQPGYFTWWQHTSDKSTNLYYTYLGSWSESLGGSLIDRRGFYVAGFQTPVSEIPTGGTATYGGQDTVHGQVFAGPVGYVNLVGDSSLVANFGTGKISGSFTNMRATSVDTTQRWNTVSIDATISGNGFAGTTSAKARSEQYSLGASSGAIAGGFYGPAALELGAVWTLSDGTHSAAGVVGSTHAP